MGQARSPAQAGAGVDAAEFSHKKLEIAFGKEKADQLVQQLKDVKAMAETNRRAAAGSDTQRNKLASHSVGIRGETAPSPTIELPALAGAVGGPAAGATVLTVKGGNKLLSMGLRGADRGRNALMGLDLMSAGPEAEAVLNRLASFSAARNAPSTFLPNLANDPRTNLLLQAVTRQQQRPAPSHPGSR